MNEQRVEVSAVAAAPSLPLRRSLSLLQATLYGLGVTIGAGIYVLIGAAAARAGMHAPIAFALAAILMALTAASFAEPRRESFKCTRIFLYDMPEASFQSVAMEA